MESQLDKFLNHLEIERGLSPNTIEAYKLDLGRGLIPFLWQQGKSRCDQVTADDIRAYLDFIAKRGNARAARARKLAAAKSFFNYLVDTEQLSINPAARIKSPKLLDKQPVSLGEDECARLLQTVAHKGKRVTRDRDLSMLVLFLHTGIRASELTGLKLTDVDLQKGQMKISRKGGKEQYLYLNKEVKKLLTRYLANRPRSQNGQFFVGTKGQNFGRKTVYEIVHRCLMLANIDTPGCGPHLLRRTFCTRLHRKGIDPFVIKRLAGHKSLSTTMRYVEVEDKEGAEALDKLEFGTL